MTDAKYMYPTIKTIASELGITEEAAAALLGAHWGRGAPYPTNSKEWALTEQLIILLERSKVKK